MHRKEGMLPGDLSSATAAALGGGGDVGLVVMLNMKPLNDVTCISL